MLAVPTYSRERVSSLTSSPVEEPISPNPQKLLFAHTDTYYPTSPQSTSWVGTSPKKYQRYKATVPTIYPSSPSSSHRSQKQHLTHPLRPISPTLQVTPHLYGRTDSPYTKFDVYEHYHYAVSPLPESQGAQTPQKVSHVPHPESEQRTLTRVTATTSMSDLLRQETASPEPNTIATIRHFAEENALARQELVRQWMAGKAASPTKAASSDIFSSTKSENGSVRPKSEGSRTVTRRPSLYEPKNKEVFAKWLLEKKEREQRQAMREKKRREQLDLYEKAKCAAAAATRRASYQKWTSKKALQEAQERAIKEKADALDAAKEAALQERKAERRQRVQSMPVSIVPLKLAKHSQPWIDLLPESLPPSDNQSDTQVLSPPMLYNDYTLHMKHASPNYITSRKLLIAHAGQEVLAAKRAEGRRAQHTRWAPKSNAGRCLHRIL